MSPDAVRAWLALETALLDVQRVMLYRDDRIDAKGRYYLTPQEHAELQRIQSFAEWATPIVKEARMARLAAVMAVR